MTIEVATYQFQSWARRGISAQINEQDTLARSGATLPPQERASVPVGVSINGAPQPGKDFALIGPGDIIGIHRDMVVRTEPRNFVTNFEPNYLAFIEFYDEDFPWRYTPARPDGERLRPWLQLLVLEEGEFGRDDRRVPLPVVTVKRKEALPLADETWLFAHVHTEQEIPGGELSNLEIYLRSLQQTITTDPDKIYSRLLSPRHLGPNRTFHAFLVPAFEVGRLAGLGRPTAGVPGQKPAWDATTASIELPIYYDWSFRTGEQVDFESLVRLLEPQILDSKIGIRSMDCSEPGFVEVDDQGRPRLPQSGLPAPAPAIQGLEGALRTERTRSVPETFTPNAFQDELKTLVNLPETMTSASTPSGNDDEFLDDPIVSVPFYGQNHARQHRTDQVLFDPTRATWLHELNRDPRARVPAGFGTSVIQKKQDELMRRAWQQVEKVFEANRTIRKFQFMLQVSARYRTQLFERLGPAQLLAMTTPVHAKVLGSPTTIRQQLLESRLAAPVLSPAFRRLVRPAGKLTRRASAAGNALDHASLVEAVNDGRITPAPPRTVPAGIPAVDDLAGQIQPPLPGWRRWLIAHRRWLLIVALILVLAGGWLVALGLALALAAVVFYRRLSVQSERAAAAEALVDPVKAQAVLASVPARPDFTIVLDEGEAAGATPVVPPGTVPPLPGSDPATPASAVVAGDSVEAARFRVAATHLVSRAVIRLPEAPAPAAFELSLGHAKLLTAIDPRVSFPRRLSAIVKLPNLSLERPEEIVDAMAHPDFEDAMYSYLRDINKELLIPNLQLIPPNSISLLETNPPFIEAYMAGLNHEMGRELLWREYPTDLRGSYFRQFWEVKGISNPDTPADAEKLKDVTKLHTWPSASRLGTHKPQPPANADVQPGEKQVVLVIRGELLKRYPNTVIYAQKAVDDGKGNLVVRETDLTVEQFDKELKFPLFRAEIDPDLRFFGFDLTTAKAKGSVDSNGFPGDKRGWFFVIQEVPGEPRFGMDIKYEPTQDSNDNPADDPRDTWNNLAWTSFGASEPAFVQRVPAPTFPRPDVAELSAHLWGSNAAQMAYVLFQAPAMVAVHASEMVEKVAP